MIHALHHVTNHHLLPSGCYYSSITLIHSHSGLPGTGIFFRAALGEVEALWCSILIELNTSLHTDAFTLRIQEAALKLWHPTTGYEIAWKHSCGCNSPTSNSSSVSIPKVILSVVSLWKYSSKQFLSCIQWLSHCYYNYSVWYYREHKNTSQQVTPSTNSKIEPDNLSFIYFILPNWINSVIQLSTQYKRMLIFPWRSLVIVHRMLLLHRGPVCFCLI